MPTGALIRISRTHQVDEVWTPRDCPDTLLTRAEAKALRIAAIASDARPYVVPTIQPAEQPSAPDTNAGPPIPPALRGATLAADARRRAQAETGGVR